MNVFKVKQRHQNKVNDDDDDDDDNDYNDDDVFENRWLTKLRSVAVTA